MDTNSVINHLKIISTWAAVGKDPIYKGIGPKFCENVETWADDALTLIKEQNQRIWDLLSEKEKLNDELKEHEPALPTWSQGKAYCGKCGRGLPRKRAGMEINYCGYCGKEVKWNV